MSYNGWTNFETWCVALWIDNDEGLQSYWQEQGEHAVDGDASRKAHDKDSYSDAACDLSRQLKDEFDEQAPELEGFWADLLNSALSEVNWREIAESIVSEVEVESSDD